MNPIDLVIYGDYIEFMFPDDRVIAESEPCEACGHEDVRGMGIAKFENGDMASYRCFAVCEKCEHTVEF